MTVQFAARCVIVAAGAIALASPAFASLKTHTTMPHFHAALVHSYKIPGMCGKHPLSCGTPSQHDETRIASANDVYIEQIVPDSAVLPKSSTLPSRGQDTEQTELAPSLMRKVVDYPTKEPPGTIIVDTPNTYLYLVLGDGQALRYGIGVGREGFTWAGTERISQMKEWPDWTPPSEMLERQPYLPRMMAGGPGNPLGARALYLGHTLYRIHGTNEPSTIGTFVSSGCIRLINSDVEDLYQRVHVGTRVVVLPAGSSSKYRDESVAKSPAEKHQ
jgi:lipoprotein-anchoring transpeptidase ErfK/SrfK